MSMERSEWERRYRQRLMERASVSPELAQEVLEACTFQDIYNDYEDDPEGSADEEMDCWTD